MTEFAISCNSISKVYQIGEHETHRALRHALNDALRSPLRRFRRRQDSNADVSNRDFWALRDVSFTAKHGEVIGIIGRNGAGKSTLLKVLSRITKPTSGEIKINGRIGSLLEVGTGFHPELTGRENIFLNGTILGMKRREIQAKFDEIVAFAEIGKFLDTPVKRYSSGMYVRLAFAVAAHLEPEILVIDEVLAVGDAQFQKKCLGKMSDVATQGRTILFVSHQMSAIERLCSRVVMLDKGSTLFDGETKEAISYYLQDLSEVGRHRNLDGMKRSGTGLIKLTGFQLEDNFGQVIVAASSGEDVVLVFEYQVELNSTAKNISLGFSLHTALGDTLVVFYSDYAGVQFDELSGTGEIRCRIHDLPFSTGKYLVGARILTNGIEADWIHGFIGSIDVEAGDFYGSGNFPHSGIGHIMLRGDWSAHESKGLVQFSA